jgi:hypothetical protein
VGAPRPVVDRPSPERPWNRARYLLLACWALVVLAVPTLGAQPTSLGRLESAVAAGQVRAVRLEGGLPPHATGFATVQVYWRSGLLRHQTEVVEARPRRQAAADAEPGRVVLTRPVAAHLRDLQPGLRTTRGPDRPSSYATLWGWYMPSWLGLVTIGLALASLYLLVNGPEPWRATRWAWFWLLASPVGIVAFLTLSGPTPLLPTPRPERRRLTGGWALLLSIVVTKVIVP